MLIYEKAIQNWKQIYKDNPNILKEVKNFENNKISFVDVISRISMILDNA